MRRYFLIAYKVQFNSLSIAITTNELMWVTEDGKYLNRVVICEKIKEINSFPISDITFVAITEMSEEDYIEWTRYPNKVKENMQEEIESPHREDVMNCSFCGDRKHCLKYGCDIKFKG